jgi:hypothetical protein
MDPEQVSYVPPSGGYPVHLGVTTDRELNRWWGIPFFGSFVRWILAIPHWVVLWALGICTGIWFFLGWIYILVFGRVPALYVKIATESIQREMRVLGYTLFLMPGGYPPLEPGPSKPINVQLTLEDLRINRLWGIPLVGFFVRFLVLIPQLVIVTFLWIFVGLSLLILWIPILVNGRYPTWAASFYGTTLRYTARMGAYLSFLPVPYPPIMPS